MKRNTITIIIALILISIFAYSFDLLPFSTATPKISGFESPVIWIDSITNVRTGTFVSDIRRTSYTADADNFETGLHIDKPHFSVELTQPDARSGLICEPSLFSFLTSKNQPCITKVETLNSYKSGNDKITPLKYHFSIVAKFASQSTSWKEEFASVTDLQVNFKINNKDKGKFLALVLNNYYRCDTDKNCFEVAMTPTQIGNSFAFFGNNNDLFTINIVKLPHNTNAQYVLEYVVEYNEVIKDYYVKTQPVSGIDYLDKDRQVGSVENFISSLKSFILTYFLPLFIFLVVLLVGVLIWKYGGLLGGRKK